MGRSELFCGGSKFKRKEIFGAMSELNGEMSSTNLDVYRQS